MVEQDTFLVREFARLAGVTVRTLQFYDREGLLKPSAHTEAGHRLYRRADAVRRAVGKWRGPCYTERQFSL